MKSARPLLAAALGLAGACSSADEFRKVGLSPEALGTSPCAGADAGATPSGMPTEREAVFGDEVLTVTERVLPPAEPDPYASYVEDEPRLRYGLAGPDGTVVVPAVYAEIGYLAQDGLLQVRCEQRYGLIGPSGVEVVPAVFGAVRPRSEGLVAVYAEEARGWGYYGTDGTASLAMRYENALPFANGRAFVLGDGSVSVIGRSGERLAGPIRHARYISDTFGTYRLEDEDLIGGRAARFAGFAPVTLASTHPSTGLLGTDGTWTLAPIYDRVETTRRGPYVTAVLHQYHTDGGSYDAGMAVFGLDGEMIVAPTPGRSVALSYGDYFVEMDHEAAPTEGRGYVMGLIAQDGERVVPTAYDTAAPIEPSEALDVPEGAYFSVMRGDRRQILARGGTPVTGWHTDNAALMNAFREALAAERD